MIFEKIRERLQKKSFVDYEEYYTDNGECLISISEAIDIINQVEAEYKEEYKSKCADCTRRKFYMMGYQAAKENNGWIPCSERLPENAEWVLCYGKNREGEFKCEVSDYIYEINGWMCSRIKEVIAWQPLPQPPKGE